MKQFFLWLFGLFRDITTGKDGVSFDPIRIGMILTGASAIFFTGWGVIENKEHFDVLSFCGGMAALFAGGGAGINLKARDEPGG